jgi:hypothetical protein
MIREGRQVKREIKTRKEERKREESGRELVEGRKNES